MEPAVLVVGAGCATARGLEAACARLVRAGFAAQALGLGRLEPADADPHLEPGYADRAALRELELGLRALVERPDVDAERVAVLGLCLGGTLAFLAGCTSTLPAALVVVQAPLVYPELGPDRPVQPLELALNLARPLLGAFGGRDPHVPVADLERLRQTLAAGMKTHELAIEPAAPHGFLDEGSAGFDGARADRAWERIVRFLRDAL